MTGFRLPAFASGHTIGLWTPASAVTEEAVSAGLSLLAARGFSYRLGEHAFSNHGITAAPPEQRLADLHAFLEDDDIRAIWGLRGGYGTVQLLEKLDYELLLRKPKLLIGFSDVTALHWGIFQRTGIPMVSGLALTLQFSDVNPYLDTSLDILTGKKTALTRDEMPGEDIVIHRSGGAEGTLLGGTLSMIASLCGSSFLYDADDLILYLEDIEEPLYRIDRLLWQLYLSGLFERTKAVLLGKFIYQGDPLDVTANILPLLPSGIPVVSGIPYGHLTESMALPQGVHALLETDPLRLSWSPFIHTLSV